MVEKLVVMVETLVAAVSRDGQIMVKNLVADCQKISRGVRQNSRSLVKNLVAGQKISCGMVKN